MEIDEKLRILRNELEGYGENTAMYILIQGKIEELEWCEMGSIASHAIREYNKAHTKEG